MQIPKKLQSTLWSVNVNNLDLEKDKTYIIHQIFSYGSLEEIKWVMNSYSKTEIKDVFTQPYKDYKRSRFYFIKDALLQLSNWLPDERYYVKNTSRIIG
ncbi:MAG: hypothetical protein Q7R95_04360 [bacterium]|nr:hypothetical protein [bacterium]